MSRRIFHGFAENINDNIWSILYGSSKLKFVESRATVIALKPACIKFQPIPKDSYQLNSARHLYRR